MDADREVKAAKKHMVDKHGFHADYFEANVDIAGPFTLENLRWLHAPWIKTREYADGCKQF